MLPGVRFVCGLILFVSFSAMAGCGSFNQEPEAPQEPAEEAPAPTPAPRHEVFTLFHSAHPAHTLSVLYPPPPPAPELPPEAKPAGNDVVWVSGYWMWDTSHDDWVWVSGVWVHAPPRRHWVPGYWSVASDGWRWVPGYWDQDAPPPPPSPPPTLAYAPNTCCYDDAGFPIVTGYGWWWPWGYRYRLFHHSPQGFSHHSLFSCEHVASNSIAIHGPHAAEAAHFLVPTLASNIHEPIAQPPHLNMASILASVPKPMTTEFVIHPELRPSGSIGSPALSLGHGGHSSSIFSTAHLGAMFHEHSGVHEAIVSHPGGGGVHASCSHGSGGHSGGGHGR